jgi:phosphate starvation-inducible PhoH-like protein
MSRKSQVMRIVEREQEQYFEERGVLVHPKWGRAQAALKEQQRTQRFVKNIQARTPGQAEYMAAIESSDLVWGIGPAGCGKTYLAVAMGVHLLDAGKVDRLVFCRPAVEAGERLGFLPGNLSAKIDPYMRPIYDVLHERMPPQRVTQMLACGTIEILPYAFMRGRTLSRSYIVADEANNATVAQLKMLLTRPGEGTILVINGDPGQSDLPAGQSGLQPMADHLSGKVMGMKTVVMTGTVRCRLVSEVIPHLDGI